MRIFISGIAGFLGSHLAERLLSMGHMVVGCDSLLGGELINVPPEAEFYQYDCRDFNAMAKVMRGCELVYHCAATAYEGLSVFAPAMIMDNIVTGSVSVFSAAIADGARRIVFCSSMARYGTNAVPFLESYDPRPQDPYGIAKVDCRAGADQPGERARRRIRHRRAAQHHRRPAEIRRPDRNVASIMANLMLQRRSPFIYGDGEQMRCFSHIEDCLSCLLAMGLTPRGLGEVVNIGPDEEFVSINQLFRQLKATIGFEGPGDPPDRLGRRRCARPTARPLKARELLGNGTTRTLEDGLEDIVAHIRQVGPRKFRYHWI